MIGMVALLLSDASIACQAMAKGNDKGKVEGLVGDARRNFMVPPLMHASMHCRAVNAALCQLECLQ